MKVYRLTASKYAKDKTGEGAKLYGGRWNHKGTPCIYTAENRSLAILEYSVNISDLYLLPRALSIVTFDIPVDNLYECPVSALPGNWKEVPAPAATKDFGTNLLSAQGYLVIKLPSTVVPQEFNYLINPLHPDMDKVKLIDISDFVYDIRIKGSS